MFHFLFFDSALDIVQIKVYGLMMIKNKLPCKGTSHAFEILENPALRLINQVTPTDLVLRI